MPLEQSIALYERGAALKARCEGELKRAEMKVEQITTERATRQVPIRTSCKALGVSESWYYKHRARPVSDRGQRREALTEEIWGFYRDSDYTYGSPRITLDLWEAGWQVSVNTVAEIMAEYGWAGRVRPAAAR